MTADEKYMREAIKQAKKAYAIGEVPIGCVIVYQDKIIARGYNRRTIDKNTQTHADVPPDKLAANGITDRILRMSVGIESKEDLVEELERVFTLAEEELHG